MDDKNLQLGTDKTIKNVQWFETGQQCMFLK